MKHAIFIVILQLISISLHSQVSVRGYYRKDGTYVKSHMRSSPDGNPYNNWSAKGNINPYTGEKGTRNVADYSCSGCEVNYSDIALANEVPKGSVKENSSIDLSVIKMVLFEKKGYEFEESFSIKNNSNSDVNKISLRLIYYLNDEVIDYRDIILNAKIPSGLAKMFVIRSFDQNQRFSYKYGNDPYKNSNMLFTIKYTVLDYN